MIDSRTVSAWFDAYAASLSLYARQWVGASLADDVVHEVFVRAMGLSSPPEDVRAFLYRCVRNEAIALSRSGARRRRREESVAVTKGAWFEKQPGDLIDAQDATRAIESLPHEQREVVVLRVWGELGFQQIADLTGSSVTTAFERYKQALGTMRRAMEKAHL